MSLKIVVIGANAAGAKAAAKARRVNPDAEITVVDRGDFISYGACGLPYFIEGAVPELKELMSTPVGVARDPAFFRNVKGVTVCPATEAIAVDRTSRTVALRERQSGAEYPLPYDRLVIATGSSPVIPPLPGMDLAGIYTVKSPDDAAGIKERAVAGGHACIVGAGLIGLEMAEALTLRGMVVTLLELRDQVLPGLLDPELALLLERHLREKGVTVTTSFQVTGFTGNGRVERVETDGGEVNADLVVMAVGFRPNVALARAAGLEIGPSGAIAVDEGLRTSDPAILACGDCAEATHLVSGRKLFLALGSSANKQGRVAGINAAGGDAAFGGVLGTAIVRVFDFTAGRTGLTETEARAAGSDVETVLSPAPDRAHFFPGAKPIVLKLVADRATGRVLGLQGVGPGAVDKRLDTAVAAITFGADVRQLSQLDLAYSPPYATAMDNLIVAADILKNKLSGEAVGLSPHEVHRRLNNGEAPLLLDVRSPGEHAEVRIPGATLVPLGALRQKLDTLPRDREIITFCKISLRGYEAHKILAAAGFRQTAFLDGGILAWPFELERGPVAP